MKTAVVILNWNGRKLLEEFLPSVTKFSSQAEVVVADNCSSDDSIEFVKTSYPNITTIVLDKNYGFAGGYNEALKQVDADVLVLLNSDVEVSEGWLDEPLRAMNDDASICAIQPKLLWHKDKDSFEYAGAAGGMIDKYGYPFCRGRIFDILEKDESQYEERTEIFWASGACMFVRADVYKEFGGFDVNFFAHMEEIDLCWRMKNAGKKIMYIPQSKVFHVGGATLDKINSRKTYLNFRNGLFMMYKNLPAGKVTSTIFIRLLLDGIAAIKLLFTNGPGHVLAVIQAHFAFFARISRLKRQRKSLQASARRDFPSSVYEGSIVGARFMSGVQKFSDLDSSKFSRG